MTQPIWRQCTSAIRERQNCPGLGLGVSFSHCQQKKTPPIILNEVSVILQVRLNNFNVMNHRSNSLGLLCSII